MPKLSVIIPVFNVAEFLPACLDSVVGQAFSDMEVLCIDDGSSDASPSILDRYAASDSRIRVFHRDNSGLSAARNAGMEIASGEYLLFLDSDDALAPGALETIVKISDEYALDQLVFAARILVNRPGLSEEQIRHMEKYYQIPDSLIGRVLSGPAFISRMLSQKELFCSAPLRLLRRDKLLPGLCRFPVGILHEDNYFTFAALFLAKRVMAIPDAFYIRRIRAGSIMSSHALNGFRIPSLLSVLCNLAALKTFVAQDVESDLSFARHAEFVRKQLDGWRGGLSSEEKEKSIVGFKTLLDNSFVPPFTFVRHAVERPIVSVIIPVFNKDSYLPESLFSVLSQTESSIEIICVNDGSSDASAAMLDWFSSKDGRIVSIRQENRGVFAARNRALEFARGKYVCFLDPDDWYPDSHVLERLCTAANDSGTLICGGSFSFYENRNIRTDFRGWSDEYSFPEEKTIAYSDYQFDFGYHRFVFSREMLSDRGIRFPPFVRFQDPPFFVKAMISSGRFRAVPDVVYRYRVGHQSVNWTADGCKRGRDCLKGLLADLELARDNRLEKLFSLTVRRIDKDFAEPLAECAIVDDRFFETLCSLDPERVDSASVDSPSEVHANRIAGPVRLVRQRLISQIGDLSDRLEKTSGRLERALNDRAALDQRLTVVTTSFSYRIGRTLTWPLRMVWELVHSFKTQPLSIVKARILSAVRKP